MINVPQVSTQRQRQQTFKTQNLIEYPSSQYNGFENYISNEIHYKHINFKYMQLSWRTNIKGMTADFMEIDRETTPNRETLPSK